MESQGLLSNKYFNDLIQIMSVVRNANPPAMKTFSVGLLHLFKCQIDGN